MLLSYYIYIYILYRYLHISIHLWLYPSYVFQRVELLYMCSAVLLVVYLYQFNQSKSIFDSGGFGDGGELFVMQCMYMCTEYGIYIGYIFCFWLVQFQLFSYLQTDHLFIFFSAKRWSVSTRTVPTPQSLYLMLVAYIYKNL